MVRARHQSGLWILVVKQNRIERIVNVGFPGVAINSGSQTKT
jgi:hypothetical protein